jgi:RNA polymerase sigma factor (TIGR02999 family)
MADVTQILSQIDAGDARAAEQLLPLVYEELRKLAAAKLLNEKPGQTLQATALVHEAYLRLVNVDQARHWNSRAHFFRAAAEAMRRILVEAARRKRSLKRGGNFTRVEVDAIESADALPAEDVLAVSEALEKLAAHDADKAELVKLRYFGGFSLQEAADALGISRATADRHWQYAKTWLYCELARAAGQDQD